MKDLAEERNVFNTTLLIWFLVLQLIMTNEAFTMNGSTHTHKRVRASAVTYANERSKPIEDYLVDDIFSTFSSGLQKKK